MTQLEDTPIIHRSETGLKYRGITMHVPSQVHEGVLRMLLEVLPPPARVLDLAAGSGALTRRLLDEGYDVHAADMDLDGWSVPNIPLFRIDCNRKHWRLSPEPYRAILAVEVIEHLENPSLFLRTARQHLAGDGFLILTTPNVVSLQSRRRMLVSGEFAFFGRELLFAAGHRTPLPFWLLEDLLTSEGYKIVQRSFMGHQGMTLRPGRVVWKVFIVPFIDLTLMMIGRKIPPQANLATTVGYVVCRRE
jgi:SAM-dependent methyltransferase